MNHYMHTDKELEAIPSRFIHLRHEDGRVIHKDPRSFMPRFKNVPLYDEETGNPKVEANGDPAYKRKEIAPANDLDNYLKHGWVKCQKDGTDRPGPKPDAKKAGK